MSVPIPEASAVISQGLLKGVNFPSWSCSITVLSNPSLNLVIYPYITNPHNRIKIGAII